MSDEQPDTIAVRNLDSGQRYRDLVEHTHDLIQSVDPQGRLVFVNAAWQQAFGWTAEEAAGMPLWNFIHEESMKHCEQAFQQLMTQGGQVTVDARFVSRHGEDVFVRGIAMLLKRDNDYITHAFLRNTTNERKRELARQALEAELAQTQKMEALGRLTGGVAHDFNNLLTVNYANLDALEESVDDQARPYFNEVINATESAAALIRRLLSFSQKGEFEPKPVDVSEIALGVEGLLQHTMPPTISFHCEATPNGLIAIVDPTQLEHALINLVVNAMDATQSGEITLRTGTTDDYKGLNIAGDKVVIEIRDTGSGMSPEVAERIYEPFFTTKDKGSGIGLAQVYGFVSRSDGTIQLDTSLGVGTTFRIVLPRASDAASLPVEGPSAD